MIRILLLITVLVCLAWPERGLNAQVAYRASCPADSVDVVTDLGITFHGIPARTYVEGFLSGDPYALSRTSTGTSGLNASMIAPLYEPVERDRYACRQLNLFLSGGRSEYPAAPWVYFRAGDYYFVSRWTKAQRPSTGISTGYGTVMVFDANMNLLGTWTA